MDIQLSLCNNNTAICRLQRAENCHYKPVREVERLSLWLRMAKLFTRE